MINALIFKHLNLNEKKGHSKFIVKLVLKAYLSWVRTKNLLLIF